jgi:hypothetical protein
MRKETIMIQKKILQPKRLRRIDGGFNFIPHRFLTDGFRSALSQKELLLYFFLVVVSDRHGLSFYSYDVICSLLEIGVDEYIMARDGLITEVGLTAFIHNWKIPSRQFFWNFWILPSFGLWVWSIDT